MWSYLCFIYLSCLVIYIDKSLHEYLSPKSTFALISSESSSASCHISRNACCYPSSLLSALAYSYCPCFIPSASARSGLASLHIKSWQIHFYLFSYPSFSYCQSKTLTPALSESVEMWFPFCSWNSVFSGPNRGRSLPSFSDLSLCLAYAVLLSISSNSKVRLLSSGSLPKFSSHLLVPIPISQSLSFMRQIPPASIQEPFFDFQLSIWNLIMPPWTWM